MPSVQSAALGFLLSSASVSAGCSKDSADSHCWFGPENATAQPAWLKALKDDRIATQAKIGWTGGVSSTVDWTLTSYIQPQIHPYDRFFYDPETKKYTIAKFLQDFKDRYGGIDSVLLWPTYPLTGIDDRNQFDFFRALPGGLEGVAGFIEELHAAGVKVLQPNKPWDTGTRKEPLDNAETLAALLKQTGADGINGDTMKSFPREFWDAAIASGHPLALEPELGGTDEALNWSPMGWGYWDNPKVPVVDRFKFISEGKFMTNVCDRFSKDHTDNLQMAWFNGDGFESWENVWGTWNGITPRDGEAIRRVATMSRFLGKHGFLQSPDWEPHTIVDLPDKRNNPDVFASKWPLGKNRVWTIVNRGDEDESNYILHKVGSSHDFDFYDCYHGVPLAHTGQRVTAGVIEKGGFGCVLRVHKSSPLDGLSDFLSEMQGMTQNTLASYDSTWNFLEQTMVDIPKVGPVTSAPEGTVFVKKAWFSYKSTGQEIEGGDISWDPSSNGVDVQYSWERNPTRVHNHILNLGPFHIDKFPVTASNYSAYLKDTGYHPKDPYNWLKTWNGKRKPPAAVADLPVTYVSLEEARAYCAWKGARLPHSYEWQYAAQGADRRTYPWGNEQIQDNYPVQKTGNTYTGPEPVGKYSPAGDSPFGMSDAVGNVWQYTDEFQDTHTRSVVLKGGSNYLPSGSFWYFPQALEVNKHNKFFLMDESFERAGTIGFRCLVDAADEATVFV